MMTRIQYALLKISEEAAEVSKDALKAAQFGILEAQPLYQIEWSEPRPPLEGVCRYNHVVARVPLGEFSIEWKGWKEQDGRVIYFNGEYIDCADDLDEAKKRASEYYTKKLPPELTKDLGVSNITRLYREMEDLKAAFELLEMEIGNDHQMSEQDARTHRYVKHEKMQKYRQYSVNLGQVEGETTSEDPRS